MNDFFLTDTYNRLELLLWCSATACVCFGAFMIAIKKERDRIIDFKKTVYEQTHRIVLAQPSDAEEVSNALSYLENVRF